MDHSLLVNTRLAIVTEAPTVAPAAGEAQTKVQLFSGGVFAWIWNATGTVWEGCNWRAARGAGTPIGSVTPLFVGMEYYNTSANKMYYATGFTNTEWVDYGYTVSGGGGGGS